MKLNHLRLTALCAAVCAVCIAVPVALAATKLVRPKATATQIYQDTSKEMTILVEFKIPEADTTSPAKAKLCATGKCKSEVITKGDTAPTADVYYTPNVLIKGDELGKKLKVTSTLTIGAKHWTYTTTAKVVKNPCGMRRKAGAYHC